jgi:SAM-dependent methyltransferase
LTDEARQLPLIKDSDVITELDAKYWHGSFNGRESKIQQLSPYVGKMKSGMARVLISLYSEPGDVVLDPFSGSGVVPLEAVLLGRQAWANDLSPYAYVLTRGKLEAPFRREHALTRAKELADFVEATSAEADSSHVPEWVKEFYHPDTLREVLVAFTYLWEQQDYFLMSCLLGIMHHVRPGFLSYPASHLVPYLRVKKYPPEEHPEMYKYRDLRSRIVAKVERAYRPPTLPLDWEQRRYRVWKANSMALPIQDRAVDAIISSPPYYGALDYARDNRLRLWFLGCEDWKELDSQLTASSQVYEEQMSVCLREMHRVLKPGKACILVLGDVERDGKTRRTAEVLAEMASRVTNSGLVAERIYDDRIPDIRRSRRNTRTTNFERIVVMRKR